MEVQVQPLSGFARRAPQRDGFVFSQGLGTAPRGGITELLGRESAGRTALAQSLLATATLGGEIAAWVDCGDAFDPVSAAKAGADLGKMLWLRCGHRVEIALKGADMILHSGGFGLVILDICDASGAALQRIPLSYWYRIRRAVENTPTVMLILSRQSAARACAARQFVLDRAMLEWRGRAPFQTIAGRKSQAVSRKPNSGGAVVLTALGEA
ncbi:MAG TPA: hypothetical protein VKV74_16935 [Bryobacteraceae bacterium]|nr:hypothetical protein [Bryobacteraceae bacterium]